MVARRVSVLFLFITLERLTAQDQRSMFMAFSNGKRFQCATTSCPPFITVRAADTLRCRLKCLDEIYCRATLFQSSNSSCQLFGNNVDSNTNLEVDSESVTMMVLAGTRIPPGE